MNSRAETRADLNARQAKSIDSKQPSVSITTSRSVSELRNRYDNVISPSTKKVSPATSAPPLSVVANHELSIPPPSPISTTPAASTSWPGTGRPSKSMTPGKRYRNALVACSAGDLLIAMIAGSPRMELGDATTISEASRVRLSPDVLTAIPRCFEDPGFHVCGVPW